MGNNILRRGTTPIHRFTLPDELRGIVLTALYVTYSQGGKVTMEKTIDDATVEDDSIIVRLTQEDTLLFRARSNVCVQIRLRTAAGDVLASEMIEVPVGAILKDGVI
jgi:hypothetical protein